MKKKSLKNKLWPVFSEFIRKRDGKCISCGRIKNWKELDAGHYIPRSKGGLALYFDEKNVNAQCTYCNRFMHGNLSEYALALEKKYGHGVLQELETKKNQITKDFPFQEKITYYETLNSNAGI